MALNLEQKVQLLLEDSETLSKGELARRIQNLIENEINFSEAAHQITVQDLQYVFSAATIAYNEGTIVSALNCDHLTKDSQLIRAMCFVEAVVGLLRSKNLIHFTMNYENKKPYKR